MSRRARTIRTILGALIGALALSPIALASNPAYSDTLRKFTKTQNVAPLPLLSRVGNGNTGTLDTEGRSTFDLAVTVTVAGTTLNVAVEESSDGTTWTAVANVNQNAVGTSPLRATVQRRFYRLVWTQTGANYTFSVTGTAK